jgi:hypothetical protein
VLTSLGVLSAFGYPQDHHRLTDKEMTRGVYAGIWLRNVIFAAPNFWVT